MGRKKISPDLSVQVRVKKSNLFTDKEIADIAIQFGFNKGYSLASQLEDASYRFLTGHEEASISMTKATLTNTADAARHFKDSLDKSGQASKYVHSFLPSSINMTRFKEDSVMIEAAYSAACKSLDDKRTKPGTRTDYVYRGYIRELHEIYKAGTGKGDLYSRSPETGECSGQFLEFIECCLQSTGCKKNKKTIARDIATALGGS